MYLNINTLKNNLPQVHGDVLTHIKPFGHEGARLDLPAGITAGITMSLAFKLLAVIPLMICAGLAAAAPGFDPVAIPAGTAALGDPQGDDNEILRAADIAAFRLVEGADWCHPEGPESDLEDLLDHPVVQVSALDMVGFRCPPDEHRRRGLID